MHLPEEMMMNHVHWQCEVIMKWYEMIWIDLPNLTSINSQGSSFEYPRSVTLKSISDYLDSDVI